MQDKESIYLRLPYPPTLNSYYATVRGRRVLTKRGRDYKNQVQYERWEKCGTNVPFFNKSSFVSVDICMHVPDARTRDTDNILKPVFDALVYAGYLEDDYQIYKHSVERFDRINKEDGYLIVKITEI